MVDLTKVTAAALEANDGGVQGIKEEREPSRSINTSGWGDGGGEEDMQDSPPSSPISIKGSPAASRRRVEEEDGGSKNSSARNTPRGKKRRLGDDDDEDSGGEGNTFAQKEHAFDYYIHFVHWDRRMDMWCARASTLSSNSSSSLLSSSSSSLPYSLIPQGRAGPDPAADPRQAAQDQVTIHYITQQKP